MGRILAIDWGKRRCGVAVSDTLRLSANALPTLETAKLMDWLKAYVAKEPVDMIVLGMPKRLNGEDTHATKPIEELIEKLSVEMAEMPIKTVDERYTSAEAQYYIMNSGLKKSKRNSKELVDSVSATIILQTYLSVI